MALILQNHKQAKTKLKFKRKGVGSKIVIVFLGEI